MSSRFGFCARTIGVVAATVSVLAVRIPAVRGQGEDLDLLLGGEQTETRANEPKGAKAKGPEPEAAKPEEAKAPAAEPPAKESEFAKAPEAKREAGKVPPVEAVRRQAIEEIVITARKTEENLQDVPIAVTALSENALANSSTSEMKDLGYRVPNMKVQYGSSEPTSLVFQMRGQIEVDVLGTLDPPVGFYEDGVYVARPQGSNVSFLDVKNVQVLRGPQGTLFGRNTTGGAILLSTNDPDFEGISGSVGATVGSFDRRAFSAILNVPLLHDVLGLRVAGETTSTDGFAFEQTNDRNIATEKNDLVRAKLLYRPLPDLSFLLAGQYIDVNQLGLPIKPVFALKPTQAQQVGSCCLAYLNATAENINYDSFTGGDPDRAAFDPGLKPTSKINVQSLTLTSTWEQPWATVKFIGGARRNSNGVNHLDIDGSPSRIVDSLQANSNLQQSYELQFTGSWLADRLRWATGTVYFDESGNETGTTSLFAALLGPVNPLISNGDIRNRSAGAYAQGTYSLTPKLRVTGGLRYSWDNKRLVLHTTLGPTCEIPSDKQDPGANCKGTFDDSWSNLNYLVGTDYRLLEDTPIFDNLLVYTSLTTGYRSGGQNIRGISDATLGPFKPETLMQFEAGFKSELLDRRIRLNGAGFYSLFHDIQRTIVAASASVLPATVVQNAASAEISGAELELTALPPIAGLNLGAGLGLTLPKYNKFSDASGDRSGEEFNGVPKTTYMLSGDYTREVFGIPWMNRLDWSWQAKVPWGQGELRYFRSQGVDLEHLVTQPPVNIVNARSVWTFKNGLEIGAFGKDLTNERTTYAILLGGGPDFVQKTITNAGREFGGDVTYRF